MSIFIWRITCANKSECGKATPLLEIADLVDPAKRYLNKQGRFLCSWCGGRGYIVDFNPVGDDFSDDDPHKLRSHLLGIIPTSGYEERENRPIAFLESFAPDDPPQRVWFFNQPVDRRRLENRKTWVPVYSVKAVLDLLTQMVKIGFLDRNKVIDAVREN